MVNKKDADEESLNGFIKHIGCMVGKAKSGWFIDAAHVNLAVRKLTVSNSYKVFTAGNPEQALIYYALEYMKILAQLTSLLGHVQLTRNCSSVTARSHALATIRRKVVVGMRRHAITGIGAPIAAAVHILTLVATRNELVSHPAQLTMFVTLMHPLNHMLHEPPLHNYLLNCSAVDGTCDISASAFPTFVSGGCVAGGWMIGGLVRCGPLMLEAAICTHT